MIAYGWPYQGIEGDREVLGMVRDLMGDGNIDAFDVVVADILILAAVLAALTVIFKTLRPAYRAWKARRKRWDDFFDDYFGQPEEERDGVVIPGRPGVMKRLQDGEDSRANMTNVLNELRDEVTAVSSRLDYELSPNSGHSLRDEVRDIKDVLDNHIKNVKNKEET